MEAIPRCAVHRRRPVEYVCLACENLRMCEECKREHVNDEGHAPEDCKEVGQKLMEKRIQDAGGRQAKELAKGLKETLNELEAGILQEIGRFWSSPVQTVEQRKMKELVRKGKYAELYFYVKGLPADGANNEAATRGLNKGLLKVLDIAYEGLHKVRSKIAAGAGQTLTEIIAKAEGELRRLTEILHKSEEDQKRLTRNLQKSEDERKKLEEILQKNEDERKRQVETQQKSEEELKRLTDLLQDSEEGRKRLAEILQNSEKEQKRLAEALQKSKREQKRLADLLRKREEDLSRLTQDLQKSEKERKKLKKNPQKSEEEEKDASCKRVADRLLAEYTGYKAYEKVKDVYEELVSNSERDSVLSAVMLIHYRSFAHACDLDNIHLDSSSVDDKGATIIACGLKLSTEVFGINLGKQTPAD